MSNIDALVMKTIIMVDTAHAMYGDRWIETATKVREEELEPHMRANKTKSLLSSALAILRGESENTVRSTVLIAAAVDPSLI